MIMKIDLPFKDMLPSGVCSFKSVEDKLLNCRKKQDIPKNAESVIVYLFPYYLGEEYYENSNISKYAVPCDYHKVVGEYLIKITTRLKNRYPDYEFKGFVDNSPIPEVYAGVLSGVGVKGKNGLLINEKYGSFCFIGEVVTDMKIECTSPTETSCLNCGACQRKCPRNNLSGEFIKDNCLSELTQKKGELSSDTKRLMSENNCIWGCDICQNSCPMNDNIAKSPIPEFYKTAKSSYGENDIIEGRAFAWRGEAVIKRNLHSCNSNVNNV